MVAMNRDKEASLDGLLDDQVSKHSICDSSLVSTMVSLSFEKLVPWNRFYITPCLIYTSSQ